MSVMFLSTNSSSFDTQDCRCDWICAEFVSYITCFSFSTASRWSKYETFSPAINSLIQYAYIPVARALGFEVRCDTKTWPFDVYYVKGCPLIIFADSISLGDGGLRNANQGNTYDAVIQREKSRSGSWCQMHAPLLCRRISQFSISYSVF